MSFHQYLIFPLFLNVYDLPRNSSDKVPQSYGEYKLSFLQVSTICLSSRAITNTVLPSVRNRVLKGAFDIRHILLKVSDCISYFLGLIPLSKRVLATFI